MSYEDRMTAEDFADMTSTGFEPRFIDPILRDSEYDISGSKNLAIVLYCSGFLGEKNTKDSMDYIRN